MDPQKEQRYHAWLTQYYKKAIPGILLLGFFAIIAIVISLLAPWPLKFLADSVFGEVPPPHGLLDLTQPQLLLVVIGAFVGISVFQALFDWVNSYIAVALESNLRNKIQETYFKHMLSLPLNSDTRLDDSDYIFRLSNEGSAVANLALNSSVDIFRSVCNIFSILLILLLIDWEMTMISLLTIPLLFMSVIFFNKRLEKQAVKVEEMSSSIFSHVSESIQHADIVQSFNRQTGQYNKFTDLLQRFKKLSLKGIMLDNKFGFVGTLIIGLATVGIFVVGGNKVFAGELTFGILIVFITYVSQMFGPLEELTGALGARSESHGQAKRFFEVIDDHQHIEDMVSGEVVSGIHGQIDFRGVHFSYKGREILKGVNLHIKPGEKVAFIGPSGAGKSTLLSLLPRFGLQDKGFIYIDGKETSDIRLDSLRDQVAMVSQEPELFSITIGENIGFAKPDAQYPLPEVMAAASNAFASEFINKLPDRYDTIIDGKGDNLSGGQKQRIAIARAMFKRAPILILDEPTSAQDANSESKVLEGISRLMKGKTVLMVTHKHSLLAAMDTIYVVEGGEVRNVKDYGGLDSYERYLQVHELKREPPKKTNTRDKAKPADAPTASVSIPKSTTIIPTSFL
jgi:ABC-type multidrug transport system fused ATPase/permease subunit